MFWIACKVFFAMAILTGCLYPFIITEIARVAMPSKANGSLIYEKGQLRGSELIAQPFHLKKYFWPRPSAANYNPLLSQASNLGPTSQKLKNIVQKRAAELRDFSSSPPPSDLLYSSGSGLDPHICIEAALFQLDRIAKERNLSSEDKIKLHQLIEQLSEGTSALLGPPHVNVFLLNMALDQQFLPRQP